MCMASVSKGESVVMIEQRWYEGGRNDGRFLTVATAKGAWYSAN